MNAVEQAEVDIDDKADAQIGIHRTEEEIASYLTQFLKVVRPASGGDDVGGGEVVVSGEDVKEVEKEAVVGVKRKAEEGTEPRKKKKKKKKKKKEPAAASAPEERDKFGQIIRMCGVDGCTYKTGHTYGMKVHKASKHNIDVVWHFCGEPGCEYKAKHGSR